MTIAEIIERLQEAIEHGQSPDAELMAFDPDLEEWAPVTILSMNQNQVRCYTDEP